MRLDFEDAESLALSCDIWALCFIAKNNYENFFVFF